MALGKNEDAIDGTEIKKRFQLKIEGKNFSARALDIWIW